MKTQRNAFMHGVIFVFVAILFFNVVGVTLEMIRAKNELVANSEYLNSYDTRNIAYEGARLLYEEADADYAELIYELKTSNNPVDRILGGTSNIIRVPFVAIIILSSILYFMRCYNLFLRRRCRYCKR